MLDIGVDRDFDVIIDQRNDVNVKRGLSEFEQRLMIYIQSYFSQEIGTINRNHAKKRLELYAQRMVDATDSISDIEQVTVTEGDDPGKLEMNIIYSTGETTEFEI